MIDGFGIAPAGPGNAISLADKPALDALCAAWPSCPLEASGLEVGLPDGIMGNSEVGHLNIGAGRVVPQDIVRIDQAISSGTFLENEALCAAADAAVSGGGRLHLMGLYSDGNVHSAAAHVHALVDLAAARLPADRVLLHLFTDGRDTPPRSADGFVRDLEQRIRGRAVVATVTGRYFAMDRDRRWERTARAYGAVVRGEGLPAATASAAVAQAYDRGEGDEFIQPTVLDRFRGAGPLVRAGDGAIFWNYRADRARQLCHALTDAAFEGFDRGDPPVEGLRLASMTQYEAGQSWLAAFPPVTPRHLLADVWSQSGLRQLRIAETEKYAHVTYFFNGGVEKQLPGEQRILVQSPKVATYDLRPEMSAPEVTDRLVEAIRGNAFDVAVLNFANPDMVGHTGDVAATVRAVQTVDRCIARISQEILSRGGVLAVTADHGNAEQMIDPSTGGIHTAHTTNPVPFMVCGGPPGMRLARSGRLADVAPTLLALSGLEQPREMTGRSLLDPSSVAGATA